MKKLAYLYLIIVLVMAACAPKEVKETAPLPKEEKPPIEKLSPKEQDERAMEVFEEILELTTNPDRQSVVPRMETLYKEIIRDYPDSQLAMESYFRLIKMSFDDHNPPLVEEAKKLYKEFLAKYPDSRMRAYIEDTIARAYYNNELWNELLEFCTPTIKNYINTGTLNGPFYMFLYSEAKYRLGDINEAKKGYKIVIQMFPGSAEAALSKKRLEEIEKK